MGLAFNGFSCLWTNVNMLSQCLIHFSPVLQSIWKPVVWHALQIKWLVSIWNALLGWNGLMMEFQCLFAKEVVVGSSPIGVMPDFPEDISIVGIYVNILLIYVGYKVVSNETTKWKTLIWKVFYLRNYFHLNIKKILNFSWTCSSLYFGCWFKE